MIHAIANQKIVSNKLAGQIISGGLSLAAALVMILGIRRLPEMDLTEAQVLMGSFSIMSFAGICLVLAMLVPVLFKSR